MKLQQLRYFVEVVRHGFSVSETAKVLFASQPGVSHGIHQLEQHLKTTLFVRRGKRILGLTDAGRDVLVIAERMIFDAENLRRLTSELHGQASGELVVAATHAQARYLLPPMIRAFTKTYPRVRLSIKLCNPVEAIDYVRRGEAHLCVSTEIVADAKDLLMIPGAKWTRCVITTPRHPLLQCEPLELSAIAEYPLITYDFALSGNSQIASAFEKEGLTPTIVLTSADTGILKTLVAAGLGVGIISSLAFSRTEDRDLKMLDASHLFPSSMTTIGVRRDGHITRYMCDFIKRVLPESTRSKVDTLLTERGGERLR